MPSKFAVVDLFAGPGGLAEGFSSILGRNGERPFSIELSVEKEISAFKTLLLRSFLRQFEQFPAAYYDFLNGSIEEPDWKTLFPDEWNAATQETLNLELGSSRAKAEIDLRLDLIKQRFGSNIVLIGGPPCQAYSLVGRARNKGIVGYKASGDHRHFLYKEYIRILDRVRPAIFVMENVKGLLSSSVNGKKVFDQVLDDLSAVGDGMYRLVPLLPKSISTSEGKHAPAQDFIVKSEELGLPQARHRVIVVGMRQDIFQRLPNDHAVSGLLERSETEVVVRDVLSGMPKLRSGLSNMEDNGDNWCSEAEKAMKKVARLRPAIPRPEQMAFKSYAENAIRKVGTSLGRASRSAGTISPSCPKELKSWLTDPELIRLPNNETRGHMPSDLARYFFASLYGKVMGISPKAGDYPAELAPDHRNWETGKFADRFRVQLWMRPATTITSHISKDGHYFIHPDPQQCRSLTVREAARIQTFPDNYFFKGNRTQQYVQVGNAVPPFLSKKIADALHKLLEPTTNRRSNSVSSNR